MLNRCNPLNPFSNNCNKIQPNLLKTIMTTSPIRNANSQDFPIIWLKSLSFSRPHFMIPAKYSPITVDSFNWKWQVETSIRTTNSTSSKRPWNHMMREGCGWKAIFWRMRPECRLFRMKSRKTLIMRPIDTPSFCMKSISSDCSTTTTQKYRLNSSYCRKCKGMLDWKTK